jgi:protocatechuate 3,4-dioxygenase beta subunit
MKLAALLLFATLSLPGQQPAGDTGFVSGRVVNAANNEPVNRARLILRRTDDPAGGSGSPTAYTTLTDDHGRFAMKGIEPGKYEFSAQRSGFANTSYGARRPGRDGITVTLEAAQQLNRLLFRMTPHAVISGRILDQDGDPVHGVSVRVVRYRYMMGRRQLVPLSSAGTDDLGEYRIFGIAPGRYYLEATYRNFGMMMPGTRVAAKPVEESYIPTYFPGTADVSSATTIELAPGAQIRGVDFTLFKGRTVRVRGHVNVPAGINRQMVMIMLSPKGRFVWDFMRRARGLDPEGAFEITDVRPGSYNLSVTMRDGKVAYGASQQVEVTSTNVENLVLNLSAGTEMTGQVRFEGQPPPSMTEIRVGLGSPDPEMPQFGPRPNAEVKEDGSFSLSSVGTEIYEPSVSGLPEGYYLKSVRIGDDELKAVGVDTTRGVPGPLLLTISDKAGQMEGVVQNAKEQPVPGATVVLVPERKKREKSREFRNVTTDQHGRYVIKTIEPGEYKLFAWEDIEPGEYMDPEVLKPVEERGHPVSIHEGSHETADLKLIPAKPPAK